MCTHMYAHTHTKYLIQITRIWDLEVIEKGYTEK